MSEEVAAAIGDIAYWQRQAEQAQIGAAAVALALKDMADRAEIATAEAAALRRLIINYRNVGLRLATPQTQQWADILQEAKLAERALYAAVEQPGAGAALLAELEAARALAEATCAEFTEPGATCSIRLADAIIAYKAARKGGADVEQS